MSITKDLVKRLPPIRRLIEQRAELIAQREALTNERDALTDERNALTDERNAVVQQRDALQAECSRLNWWAGPEPHFVPPGHFYSPIPSIDYVQSNEQRLFAEPPPTLPAIDLNEPGQIALLSALQPFYADLPFSEVARPGLRFFYDNPSYSYSDAVFLYCMIRHLRPRRIVEVGSGHSSCLTLDVNDLYFDGGIECTFIEPYPELLLSLLNDGDKASLRLVAKDLQEVPLSTFAELAADDILFIDSTHVSKVGSDVNYIVFEVLPALAPGVCVHIHDVFYPFAYPMEWTYEGRSWNEDYLLRAFLQFNREFEIVLFSDFLHRFHGQRLAEHMPLCLRNKGGSIWLRRR